MLVCNPRCVLPRRSFHTCATAEEASGPHGMQVPPNGQPALGLETTPLQHEANLEDHAATLTADPPVLEPPLDSAPTIRTEGEGEQERVPLSEFNATDLVVRVEQASASYLTGEDFSAAPLAYVLRHHDMASDEDMAEPGRNLGFGMLPDGPTLQSLHAVWLLSQCSDGVMFACHQLHAALQESH